MNESKRSDENLLPYGLLISRHRGQVNGKNVPQTHANALKELHKKVMLLQSSVSHFSFTTYVHTYKRKRLERKRMSYSGAFRNKHKNMLVNTSEKADLSSLNMNY